LWTSGTALRWLTSVYLWHWRVLLPVSGALELAAFAIFLRSVSGHRPQDRGKGRLEEWVLVVVAGSVGFLSTLLVNFGVALFLSLRAASPSLPPGFDQRFLVLQTWGFLVPFVWGFSAKWLPIFLGLRSIHGRILLLGIGLNSVGVLAALAGRIVPAAFLLLAGVITYVYSLRLFEPSERCAKVKGVHASFPVFVRLAYAWAVVAASLGIWAALAANSQGIWGASRHALTVGFLAMMVFAIGQRVLPAFSGMRLLFSTKLMFIALVLLTAGCALRVSSEILAYQNLAPSAWTWLPVSAITEMAAATVFAVNLLVTFARRPPSTMSAYRSGEGPMAPIQS